MHSSSRKLVGPRTSAWASLQSVRPPYWGEEPALRRQIADSVRRIANRLSPTDRGARHGAIGRILLSQVGVKGVVATNTPAEALLPIRSLAPREG